MKERLNDENLRPGATVILMTKRKGTAEIAFQLQLIAPESAPVACGKAADEI
jgi:hypothetical protein